MRPGLLVILTAAGLAACDDDSLPDPVFNNVEDTVNMFAVSGTEVFKPSGYAMTERRAVRIDQSASTDFAFDITPDGRPILLPGAMIGQPGASGVDPGLQISADPYDDITIALVNGYQTLDTVAAGVGQVYYLRSRIPSGCFLGVPAYGKLEILNIDPDIRLVSFKVLGNLNCGYKSLLPGLPTQ
jgi:hypothetical protein